MTTKQPVTILVPFWSKAKDYTDTEDLLRACPEIPVAKVIFDCIGENESLLDYFCRLREVVVNHDVDVVLALKDPATLLQSALVRECRSRVECPSVESSFLAYHKVYTRQTLDTDTDFSFHGILDWNSPTLLGDAVGLLERIGLPAFAKVPCGDASQGVWKISNAKQLTDVLRTMGHINEEHFSKNEHISNTTFICDFLKTVLDVDQYPMALRSILLLEPYINAPAKACVDGCVYNKEIIHWAISDSLHWPGQDIPFQGSYMPSALPDMVQKRLWDGFDQVVDRMIHYGFNNQFVHVEYFILADGKIRFIEVNARPSGNLSGLYRESLWGPLPLQALLGLCCGIRPDPPVPTGRAALNLPLQVHENYTGKVGDIVDLSAVGILEKDPDVKITMDMSVDEWFVPGRMQFGKLWTYGRTPVDAKRKCRQAIQRLVRKPRQLKFNFL